MTWNWMFAGRLVPVLLAALTACGTADDDAPELDAGELADGAADASAPACVTMGDGSIYMQCCVWDESGCGAGLACYWNDRATNGADDGACFPPGSVAVGDVCPVTANACVPGAFCLWDDDTPKTGTGTCRLLCDPARPACGALERCEVPFGDGTIGFCTGGA